jgi:hypothetical protein
MNTFIFVFCCLMGAFMITGVVKFLITGRLVPLDRPDEPTVWVNRHGEPRRYWTAIAVFAFFALLFFLAAYSSSHSVFDAK